MGEIEQSSKEVIIFVPAFDAKEKDYYINHYLAIGLTNRLENKRIHLESEAVKIAGQTGRRFTINSALSVKEKTVDIYEIYWRDLIDDINEKSIRYRVFRGFYLLIYWIFSFLKVGRISTFFSLQVLGILFLITAWEYSTLTLALTAIGNDPNALGFPLPDNIANTLGTFGQIFGGWKVWLITGALLSFLPIPANTLINLLDFMVRYSEDDAEKGLGNLRDRLRYRLSSVLDDVLNESQYEKVTILAHSLGTVLAVDCLGDYSHASEKKVIFITLGSPLKVLSCVSNWISDEITKCLNSQFIEEWTDFYSDQDWLCTNIPMPNHVETGKFYSNLIPLKVSIAKQIGGESHSAYFYDKTVLQKLIA